MIERTYSTLIVAVDAGVLRVTLNNPGRKNAIGPAMVNELLYTLSDAMDAPEVRSVVITGAGEAFCAGGDFSQMSGLVSGTELSPKGDYADLLIAIANASKPVVTRVNGHAL